MTAVTIRPLTHADEAEWRRLWRAYLDFYETTVSEEVYRTHFSRLLSDAPGEFSGLVADAGSGRLVGLTHYVFHRHGWRIEDVCYLQDLYVDADARKGGVGEALIRAVYAAADEAGASTVYWTTQMGNATARRLYDRIGVATDFIKYNRR